MILAEIADKMLPVSYYFGASIVFGVSAGFALTFLKGIPRLIGFGIVALIACFLVWALRVDSDLIAATRDELGQSYLTISRYWILGSIVIAAILALVFRIALSSSSSGGNHQAEQGEAPNRG
jgi:hypothetical protein